MMRNFTFPKVLPPDMEPLRNKTGLWYGNLECVDRVIEHANSLLLSRVSDRRVEEEERVENLRRRMERGEADAMNELGILYESGSLGCPAAEPAQGAGALRAGLGEAGGGGRIQFGGCV